MHDLRMVPPALAGWGVAAVLVTADSKVALGMTVAAVLSAGALLQLRSRRLPVVVTAVCVAAISASCSWRLTTIEHSPLAALASRHQVATLDLQIARDPSTFTQHGQLSTVVEVLVRRVATSRADLRTRDHATAFLKGAPTDLVVGRHLSVRGRLMPSDSSDEAALIDVITRGPAVRASWWWEASEHVREGIRRSVERTGTEQRALVPALVDGDDSRISDLVKDDFRRSGLTHLMAVSGTNLTIVLAVLLVVGKAAGVRRRGLWVLGALSIIGFVLLARPDPSVVRAAGMGVVGVAALGYGDRGGIRALAWAIIGLLFIDPWLARSAGFILSVCATAGILLLAPVLARPLFRWMPRWCALALAVPLAAQLSCTPAIAAISGQISLVAVVANIFAGPVVAPATVAGLLGGVVALVSVPLSHPIGWFAAACASWILEVAHRSAALDAASLTWHGPWQLLIVLVPLTTWAIFHISSRPVLFVGLSLGLVIAVWRPPETGWPPAGWLMVACDIGQGDATVLDAGHGSAVVVDAGPDPAAVDRCLDRLDIHRVLLMVFTHGHADHIDGWPGVVRGREVDEIAVGPTGGPGDADIPRHVAVPGERFSLGGIHAEVLWPPPSPPVKVTDIAGSGPNNLSVVLAVEVRGVRLLLTGDIEPEAQDKLLRAHPDLHADVIKMPHHGSARQSSAFFDAVG
ncbi:MAG: competence protein ComEC, partial [Nocardioidaceae bacterium]|nr:competence protein ComEC [Nocardioidaceae bacterium]